MEQDEVAVEKGIGRFVRLELATCVAGESRSVRVTSGCQERKRRCRAGPKELHEHKRERE